MSRGALRGGTAALILAALAPGAPAQDDQRWNVTVPFSVTQLEGDYNEIFFSNGMVMRWRDLEIRARSGLILLDREEVLLELAGARRESGLPRRAVPVPSARRQVTETLLRERMRSFLQAAGRVTAEPDAQPAADISFDLFRFLYLEGGITVVRNGLEVIRAERLYFSPPEDRMTLEGAELRLISTGEPGVENIVTIRGDSIVRSGSRWTGRDLSVTTCPAGVPHVEVLAGEVEIIERGDEFEIRSRGNKLAFSGVEVLPLPDVSYFTGEQNNIPIQGASIGNSSAQGIEVALGLGGPMNDLGGALHQHITGRPAEEFRGNWNLDLAYIEERGFPLDGRIDYGAGDLYFGYSEAFYLDDHGINIREITNRLDGSLIDNKERTLISTENRAILGAGTDLDLTLFYASDPAVYSEFFGRDYRELRVPETSVYLKSGAENRLFTAQGRWDLNGFSYQDNRAQADFFVEQLPLATFDLFSEPLLQMPWNAPLQLTSSTSVGQLNRSFDSTLVAPMEDATFRFDQELELASPFWIGPAGIRPFAAARYTYYSNTVAGPSEDRWAFSAGASAGTRLSRSWQDIRHVLAPRVAFLYSFDVGGEPADFIQYDSVDDLDEGALIQVELINVLETKRPLTEGGGIDQFLWLDLTQNFHPISDRDNGDHVGLFEYQLIVRPTALELPVPNLRMVLEGEWDWDQSEMRTLNAALGFGKVLGVDWFAEYRTDAVSDGTIGYGVGTELMSRWELAGGSQYDQGVGKTINYAANLIRHDHDWDLVLRVDYDNISGETNVSVNIVPRFGGAYRYERERSLYAGRLFGAGSGTVF